MLNQKAKAKQIYDELWKNSSQYVRYYLSLDERGFSMSQNSCYMYMQIMGNLIAFNYDNDKTWAKKHEKELESFIRTYRMRGGQTN